MTNTPEQLASELEALGESLDGADLFTVFSLVADELSYENVGDFLTSGLAAEMIAATQSNFVQARATLERMSELDDQLANL